MTFWTQEREDFLRAKASRLSAGQIAARLGCTRNAIIGKARRLGVSLSKSEGVPVVSFTPKAEPLPPPMPIQSSIEVAIHPARANALTQADIGKRAVEKAPDAGPRGETAPATLPKTLADLGDHECKWPLGDAMTPEFRYCGDPRSAPSPYCASHRALARGVGTPSERIAHKTLTRSAAR